MQRFLNERQRHRLGQYTPQEKAMQRRLTQQQRAEEKRDARKKPGEWP